MRYLNVNEIFGPTVQGEGKHTGQYVGFLRLAGCNLACSWCDTPYSWDWSRYDKKAESHKWTMTELAEALDNLVADTIIVTGGEPMLQQRGLVELKKMAPHLTFEIETNGTIAPLPETIKAVNLFTVSPKLAHAGDSAADRIKLEALSIYARLAEINKVQFKFVVSKTDDLIEVQNIRRAAGINRRDVWIMPEGADKETQLATLSDIADEVINYGFNLSPRLHVLAWGSKRAV